MSLASSVQSVIPTPTAIFPPTISSQNTLSAPVVAGVIVIMIIFVIVIVAMIIMSVILLYGYKKPQSRLGLFMIEVLLMF